MPETPDQVLHRLEQRMLEPAFRRSREDVAALLADDFLEFGSSGRTYDKHQAVELLANEPDTTARRSLKNFNATPLADGLMLVTFRLEQLHSDSDRPVSSLRSSIWKNDGGRWLLLFHQGTPVA